MPVIIVLAYLPVDAKESVRKANCLQVGYGQIRRMCHSVEAVPRVSEDNNSGAAGQREIDRKRCKEPDRLLRCKRIRASIKKGGG